MNKTIITSILLTLLASVFLFIGPIHINQSDTTKGGISMQISSGLNMKKIDVPTVKDISKYGFSQSESDFAQAILDGYEPVVGSAGLADASNLYINTAMKMGLLVSSNFKDGQINLYDLIRK